GAAQALLRNHGPRPRSAGGGPQGLGRVLSSTFDPARDRRGGDCVTTAAHVPSDVGTYLARVRAALSDVPAEERDDLLAEVEASLHETAFETEGSVAAQLGPPEDFAAELLSAAGLHPSTEPPAAGLRETIERLAGSRQVTTSLRFLRELAPIWWAVRGYVAVAALALAANASWSSSHGAVPRIGNAKLGAAAIFVAVAASIALGLWNRGVA